MYLNNIHSTVKLVALSCLMLLILSGCSASRSLYHDSVISQKSHGVIYLYRPGRLAAMLSTPDVFINDKLLCHLYNNSYCRFELAPGKYKLTVNTFSPTLNRGSVLVEVPANTKLFLSYDIEEELKFGMGLSILGKLATVGGGGVNMLSWFEEEDKLLVHIKDAATAKDEISATTCANC